MSSKSDPKPWNPITRTWDPMPGTISNSKRLQNYRKNGRKHLTRKQLQRMWKYTARCVHNKVYSCGHRMKKCDCPF